MRRSTRLSSLIEEASLSVRPHPGWAAFPLGQWRGLNAAAKKLMTGKALLAVAGGGTYVPKDAVN
jgi:hypothetical protein